MERQRHWPKLATILVGTLIFAEFLVAPIPLDDRFANVPEYYYQLSETEEQTAVLDVPIDLYGAQGPACEYMIYQTVHQKPIVGGYISRTPKKVLKVFQRPLLKQLRARVYNDSEPYYFSPELLANGLEELQWLDIGYIILHKDILSGKEVQIVRKALVSLLTDPTY